MSAPRKGGAEGRTTAPTAPNAGAACWGPSRRSRKCNNFKGGVTGRAAAAAAAVTPTGPAWYASPAGGRAVLSLPLRAGKARVVVLDYPIRALTLPAPELDYLRPVPKSCAGWVARFREIARTNGITQEAAATLARIEAAAGPEG